jgi:hypothetical protein
MGVVQVRIIMRPIFETNLPFSSNYLSYAQIFTIPKTIERDTKMFVVRRELHSDGSRWGEIFPLSSFARLIQLIPKFRGPIPAGVDQHNSLEIGKSFYINNFFTKDIYRTVYRSHLPQAPL